MSYCYLVIDNETDKVLRRKIGNDFPVCVYAEISHIERGLHAHLRNKLISLYPINPDGSHMVDELTREEKTEFKRKFYDIFCVDIVNPKKSERWTYDKFLEARLERKREATRRSVRAYQRRLRERKREG